MDIERMLPHIQVTNYEFKFISKPYILQRLAKRRTLPAWDHNKRFVCFDGCAYSSIFASLGGRTVSFPSSSQLNTRQLCC